MAALQEFLMAEGPEALAPVEVSIAPYPHPFIVRAITEGENKALRRACRRTAVDKATGQRYVETDSDLYNCKLVVACCQEPNFKDAALQERYGVRGAEELVNTLLKPGQFTALLMAVTQVNGFNQTMDSLVDTAKN